MTRAGEKLLTTVLAGACGVFFALGLALQFGLGRGYHWLPADADGASAPNPGDVDRNAFQLPPQAQFVAINERPLFNEDRKPAPDAGEIAETETAPPSPLNISLTGTVLVGKPELHIAMIRENGKAQTIALKEGMPLPGDQGAWNLTQVKSRSAVFKSSSGEEVEVELAVGNPGQKAGPQGRPNAPGAPPARAAAAQPTPTPPAGPESAQTVELQQRIEERRKQMREAAERMKAQRQQDQTNPQQHR